jgi:putative MATE family efflux protein
MRDAKLTSGPLFPTLFALALPVLAEELLNLLVGITDRFLAGWFLPGDAPQAAMGLLAYLLWLIPSLFSAVAIGGTALVARFIGAGDVRSARQVVGQALLAGGLLACVVTLLVAVGGRAFVALMGLQGEAEILAVRFIWFITPVIPVIMLEQVGSACLRGAGDTVTGLLARVAVNVVNLVVSTLLVTGWGPFPELGWTGLAIGAACGHAVGGLVILSALIRGTTIYIEASFLRPDLDLLRRLLRVGLPGGLDVLAIIGCHLLYLRIITSLGTVAAAAHSLGLQIEALSYLSGSAFQVAAATMAGQALGAKDEPRAFRSVLAACAAAMVLMSIAGLVFYFLGEPIACCFTQGQRTPTSQLTGELLKVVAWGVVPMSVLIVMSGALRGAGDTRFSLLITFLGLAGVRLPLAAWLAWDYIPIYIPELIDVQIPGVGWGVLGAWWGMVIDVTLRSVFVGWRFAHGGWMRIKV